MGVVDGIQWGMRLDPRKFGDCFWPCFCCFSTCFFETLNFALLWTEEFAIYFDFGFEGNLHEHEHI
jgi:hypothetical protein